MSSKSANKGKFKTKAANILKQKPTSMEDFLSDGEQPVTFKPHEIQGTVRKPVEKKEPPARERDERLHSLISKDIHDKLIDMVMERKKDKSFAKQQASKRGIIEEALADFFEKHGR